MIAISPKKAPIKPPVLTVRLLCAAPEKEKEKHKHIDAVSKAISGRGH